MLPIWFIVAFSIVLFFTIKNAIFRNSKIKLLGDQIPGPSPYPIIGSGFLFLCNTNEILNVLKKLSSEFGSVCRVWLARDLYVILTNPEDLQLILKNSKQNKKIKTYALTKPLLGDGLITSDGNIWQVHRKMLTPTFHFKILEHSIHVMHKSAQILVNILDEKVGKPEFDIHDYVTKCTFDIVCGSSMGVEFDILRSEDTTYFDAVVGATMITTSRLYKIWLQPEILFRLSGSYKKFTECIRHIDTTTKEIISKKREILENSGGDQIDKNDGTKYAAFLDLLFQENLSDQEILEEVKTFMFAGHDTTSSAIDFLIYELSRHAHVQDKIYEEMEKASLYVNDTCPSIPELNNQKYLESVIKESLRLYPPVPVIGRELGEDVTTTDGYRLPVGTNLSVFILAMHRDEKYYENSNKFDPERFLHDDSNRNPFVYIPFSAGPRNCIGQKFAMLEIKITIGMLIKKFKILPSSTSEPLELGYRITLRSKNGVHIKLEHRDKK